MKMMQLIKDICIAAWFFSHHEGVWKIIYHQEKGQFFGEVLIEAAPEGYFSENYYTCKRNKPLQLSFKITTPFRNTYADVETDIECIFLAFKASSDQEVSAVGNIF